MMHLDRSAPDNLFVIGGLKHHSVPSGFACWLDTGGGVDLKAFMGRVIVYISL